MTSTIRLLLAQIARFEKQHKAGLTPSCTALAEFFDTAREARHELDALERGVQPPPPSASSGLMLERVEGVPLRMTLEFAPTARAVLEALPRGA